MPARRACTCAAGQPVCPACQAYEPGGRAIQAPPRFLVPQTPELATLRALLDDAIAERKRRRQAWRRSQAAVQRLQAQMRALTQDHRRHPRRVPQTEET